MNEIICPSCSTAFKIDEAGFAEIVAQVKNQQFEEELQTRLDLAEKDKVNAIRLAEANLKNALQDDLAKKDNEIIALKAQSAQNLAEKLAQKETEIAEMKANIQKAELDKKLAVSETTRKIEKERDDLVNDLKMKEINLHMVEIMNM